MKKYLSCLMLFVLLLTGCFDFNANDQTTSLNYYPQYDLLAFYKNSLVSKAYEAGEIVTQEDIVGLFFKNGLEAEMIVVGVYYDYSFQNKMVTSLVMNDHQVVYLNVLTKEEAKRSVSVDIYFNDEKQTIDLPKYQETDLGAVLEAANVMKPGRTFLGIFTDSNYCVPYEHGAMTDSTKLYIPYMESLGYDQYLVVLPQWDKHYYMPSLQHDTIGSNDLSIQQMIKALLADELLGYQIDGVYSDVEYQNLWDVSDKQTDPCSQILYVKVTDISILCKG